MKSVITIKTCVAASAFACRSSAAKASFKRKKAGNLSIEFHVVLFLIAAVAGFGCSSTPNKSGYNTVAAAPSSAREIILENNTPTVDMPKVTLISTEGIDRSNDAAAIMAVKRRWPMAMQARDEKEFDAILAAGFTFGADAKVMNRKEYIADRISANDWRITHVVYDNMTLQFFGDHALLTYRNRVTNDNENTKEREIEVIHWADIFVRSGSEWKIAAAHVVDFRIEPNSTP